MKRLRWLVVSLACFLIGIITLLNGWNGTANATAGWPIAATAVTFCGSAHGWAAAVGLAGLLLGIVFLVVGIMSAATLPARS